MTKLKTGALIRTSVMVAAIFAQSFMPLIPKNDAGRVLCLLKADDSLLILSLSDKGDIQTRSFEIKCELGHLAEDSTFYATRFVEGETRVVRYGTSPELIALAQIRLDAQPFFSMFAREGHLYMAGTELWHIDFNADPPVFHIYDKVPPEGYETDFSEEAMFKNKRIDALACSRDTLFAVDNIMRPKFLFLYDISRPDRPQHMLSKDFGAEVNQWVRGADADAETLLVFESFSRMDGWGKEVNLFDLNTLTRTKNLGQYFSRRDTELEEAEKTAWNNAVLFKDRVYISAGDSGLLSAPKGEERQAAAVPGTAPCVWVKASGDRLVALQGERVLIFSESGGNIGNPTIVDLSSPCTEIY